MSAFSDIGHTGGLGKAFPDQVFYSQEERARYQKILTGESDNGVRVKKVKVEIFDLSDPKQVRRYERLWKTLLDKASRMEVIVDHCKNLVNRADGSSYWMKYVEYVEFEGRDSAAGRKEM